MAVDGGTSAIVMAGRRDGVVDPLAAAAGVADKCLVPVAGRPMIAHVLAALGATPAIGRIVVSLNDPDLLRDLPEAIGLDAAGRLVIAPARANLVDSVLAAAERADCPLLITTADNVHLTPAAVGAFIDGAERGALDAAVAFSRRDAVLAAHPDGQRRFYRFADDSYSNCNSYWIARRDALTTTEVFRQGGQFAKHPLRIASALGFMNLIRFRFGLGTLDAAFDRFSRRFKLRIGAVILDDGAVAIDVDNARTLAVADLILGRRSNPN